MEQRGIRLKLFHFFKVSNSHWILTNKFHNNIIIIINKKIKFKKKKKHIYINT